MVKAGVAIGGSPGIAMLPAPIERRAPRPPASTSRLTDGTVNAKPLASAAENPVSDALTRPSELIDTLCPLTLPSVVVPLLHASDGVVAERVTTPLAKERRNAPDRKNGEPAPPTRSPSAGSVSWKNDPLATGTEIVAVIPTDPQPGIVTVPFWTAIDADVPENVIRNVPPIVKPPSASGAPPGARTTRTPESPGVAPPVSVTDAWTTSSDAPKKANRPFTDRVVTPAARTIVNVPLRDRRTADRERRRRHRESAVAGGVERTVDRHRPDPCVGHRRADREAVGRRRRPVEAERERRHRQRR